MDLLPLLADSRLPTHRPFTTAEARACGVGPDVLRRLVREGQLRHVLRGVYVDAAVRDDLLSRSIALSLVVPETAVVTDETAGWLHGADVLPAGGHLHLPPVKVFQLPGHTRVRRRETQGGERTLIARDLTTVHGVPTTTPLRTALDLGRLTPRVRALGCLDSLMRAGGFDSDDLLRELPRFKGYRGVVQLRLLAPLADPRAESPGVPAPVLQLPIHDDLGLERYRADLGLPVVRLIAEYDGRDHHSSPADRAYDGQRRDWMRARGWIVVVLTHHEVFAHPDRAVDLLRRAYAEARHRSRTAA